MRRRARLVDRRRNAGSRKQRALAEGGEVSSSLRKAPRFAPGRAWRKLLAWWKGERSLYDTFEPSADKT
jgi:hypothetical protein